MVQIVPVYAAGLALLFVYLSVRTIQMRRKYQVSVGEGQHAELQRAIRAHANFAEYVPMALLMLFWLEMQSTPHWLVHILCALLLLGRVSHAYGFSQVREIMKLRVAGMMATFTVLLVAAAVIVLKAVGLS